MDLDETELLLYTGSAVGHTDSQDTDVSRLLSFFLCGQYLEILKSPPGQAVFGTSVEGVQSVSSCQEFVENNLKGYLHSDQAEGLYERELCVLIVGASCLQLFIQSNWTGPRVTSDPLDLLPTDYRTPEQTQKIRDEASEELEVEGEAVYNLSKQLLYFYYSRVILLQNNKVFTHCQTAGLWLLRHLVVHQALLDERSPGIKTAVDQLCDEVLKKESIMANDKYRTLAIQFHLEAGHLCNYYYDTDKARDHFHKARKLAGLDVELTGSLGKRTRYQREDKAQLVLQVTRSGENSSEGDLQVAECQKPTEIPKDVSLDDDTVLNRLALKDPGEVEVVSMSGLDQAVVLALCQDHRRSHEGQGQIIEEEVLAYINVVLNQPQSWSVQTQALYTRSQWEWESPRRVQRSMMQLEELVMQCERDSTRVGGRLHLVCATSLPPRWIIEKKLADLLVKIGAARAALEVYERLQMWEEVIKCYQVLGVKDKAVTLIQEQLAIKETPALYCYLGDATKDPQYYTKAWELSGQRSARAQRMLGLYYMYKEKFEESLPCLEKSLEINALQVGLWFTYGCAAIGCHQYKKAAKGFRRCVNLTNDNFEAWNNLATAYIRSGQKKRAFATLKEALKCSYENWRIWENFILVAMDVGEFEEVIQAYHRLLDLKQKHEDSELLEHLVRAVTEPMLDAYGNPASALTKKTRELFGRITSKVTSNADIWRQYGKLLTNGPESPSAEDNEKALQCLQKSYRCIIQAPSWEKEVEKCAKVARQSLQLSEVYQSLVQQISDTKQQIQLLSSCKLMLKGVITKIKQKHTDITTSEVTKELSGFCQDMERVLEETVKQIDQLKGS